MRELAFCGYLPAITRPPTNNASVPSPIKSLNASDPKLLATPDAEFKTKLHRSPGWDHHLDWLEAIRTRREATTNAETGHRSCSACLVSWIGMKLARPLKWDPDTERFNDAEANGMLHRTEREPYGAFAAARKAGFTKNKPPARSREG